MTRLKPIAAEDIPFSGRMFQIVHQKMGDGDREVTFEIARRAPGTRLLFVRDQKILLTREFRYELDRYDYRLPGGKVFDRLTDYQRSLDAKYDMIVAARDGALREAQEEVGLRPHVLDLMAVSSCGATVQWDLYYFICRDFVELGQVYHESGEDLSHDWHGFDEVQAMCLDSRITEERSAMQILKFLAKEMK